VYLIWSYTQHFSIYLCYDFDQPQYKKIGAKYAEALFGNMLFYYFLFCPKIDDFIATPILKILPTGDIDQKELLQWNQIL
jgi:hypothetical protein